ncbi:MULTISPECIES: hypothetical protein [unclassified Streptomyces]|uniref:hypothetical protein n=1 Tax=unclassified Streptomyces TaxID=2593676 RepID=UPI00081EAFDE|nr:MULTISPECIES: hypothetical protein [unclassified Streptomyces]MYR92353.1 hypothetical protein [Streptomyces sp. SID4937]SCD32039.1 hypothetical protein GA0115243_100884 [Streptomyces sp. ScaeMP-e83]
MPTDDPTPTYSMVEDDSSVHTDLAERISQFNYAPDTGAAVTALFPASWNENAGDLVTLREDGSLVLDLDDAFGLPEPFDRVAPPMMITTTTGMAVLKADHPANQTIESGFRSLNIPVPDVIQALGAREAALAGDTSTIRSFRSDVLGMWKGWDESISTALLGNWADTLYDQGRLTLDALSRLKSEASVINKQLTPVWRRKLNHARLLLLDTPLGDGLSLYDLVPGQAAADLGVEAGFDDPRLAEIMQALSPAERAVTLALAAGGVTTWAEAAMAAGATQPKYAGEQVRRKVKRLAARITGRSPATTEATSGSGR